MSAILKKLKLRPVFYAPLTADGDLPDMRNVAAIILRNAGTATVNLKNGQYTLDSKETLSLNVTEDSAGLEIQDVGVTFDTSSGAVKKLQIIALKAVNC